MSEWLTVDDFEVGDLISLGDYATTVAATGVSHGTPYIEYECPDAWGCQFSTHRLMEQDVRRFSENGYLTKPNDNND